MKLIKLALVSCACVLMVSCKEEASVQKKTPQIIGEEQPKAPGPARQESIESYALVIKKVAPAVVNIYGFQRQQAQQRLSSPFMADPFFKQFFDSLNQGGDEQVSLGSGVIVSKEGHILTNDHVIDGADVVQVALPDKREYVAKVIVRDKRTDLTLLKIEDGGDFPYLSVDPQENLEVGDVVLAIGNPFGVGQTVTSGIISALSRSQEGINNVRSFIQTDAAINPGNSGGPLITTDGRLVGINTAIYSKTGGSMGIGFAIPASLAIPVIESLKHEGHILRPWLGVAVKSISFEEAQSMGLSRPYGVVVKEVYPGSDAEKAGIKVGDYISAFNGREIKDDAALDYWVAVSPLGEKVDLTILRKEEEKAISVLLTEPSEGENSKPLIIEGQNPLQGATLHDISPALALELGFDPMRTGVIITEVLEKGFAAQTGLQPGDILESVNGQKIKTKEDVATLLKKPVSSWSLVLKRGKQLLKLQVRS